MNALQTVGDILDEMDDYHSWRLALAAFYRAEGSFQSAWNVAHGFNLTPGDKRIIDALRAAFEEVAA